MDEDFTRFSEVYDSFLSKVTDDMYMELTKEDTFKILYTLIISAIHSFEFPRVSLDYELKTSLLVSEEGKEPSSESFWAFKNKLTQEEINIIATYMVVEWLGQQLATVENTRMKYSGSDFKFTSQANHMQKILQQKKDYEREGLHLQRLYKRRKVDSNGVYRSTMGIIMSPIKHEDVIKEGN